MAAVEIELWWHPLGLVVEVGSEAWMSHMGVALSVVQHTYSFLLLHLTVASPVSLLLADV